MALSNELGVDLSFDTDAMRTAATEYQTASADLLRLKSELDILLRNLSETDWTTEAGKAFQNMAEQGWGQNLERYCDLIATLSDALTASADEYDTLVAQKIDTLRL